MHRWYFVFCQPMCRSFLLTILCLVFFMVNIEPVETLRISELKDIQFEDFSFIGEKFQLIFDRIKIAINRFRCPKGWKRLGGSCYLLSSTISLSTEVNATCYRTHSNRSHLARINNPIEFFYMAHILMRENLPSMMIEIDPTLLTGKKFTEKLIGDQDGWNNMKENLRKLRRKYLRFKEKVLDRLNASHVKVSTRTRKIHPNDTSTEIDELDYSSDTNDPFENQENHRSVCHQVEWNVLHPHSNIFLLTTYLKSEEVVCSISDIVSDYRYHHLCELVLDFCFANVLCGTYGRCVNTLHGFTCACNFFFDGFFCQKMSRQGTEALIAFCIALGLWILSWKKTRKFIRKFLINRSRHNCFQHLPRNQNTQLPIEQNPNVSDERRRTIYEQLKDVIRQAPEQDCQCYRMLIVGVSAIVILTVLFVTTTLIHLGQPYYHLNYESMNMTLFYNKTIEALMQCDYLGDHTFGNLIFLSWTLLLTVIFSYSVKRKKRCINYCDGRPGWLLPIEPFRTANRFSAAAVFGIIAFEVLKIFEKILFSIKTPSQHGVIHMLIIRIATIILLGMRYYPLLASLQLKSIVVRFFSFIYILSNIAYTIMHEGVCTGYLPLPGKYSASEQAKSRIDLGTWFVIYGLIRNIPHYFFLSFLGAELFTRFIYDSLWLPCRKNESIWHTKCNSDKEFEDAASYVRKLLECTAARARQEEYQRILGEKNDQRNFLMKIPSSIRKSIASLIEDEALFTNMAICTYTVAVVFLYYLTCTFIFLYIAKTGHLTYLEEFIEHALDIELDERVSLKTEVVLSALIAFFIFIVQLIIGMRNFKRHKLQLHKRAGCEEIPSLKSLPKNKIASNAIHYPGFLVAYMAWGFTICFHVLLIIAISFRISSFNSFYLQIALTIAIPIIIIYLVKVYSMSCCSQYAFTPEMNDDDDDNSRPPARLILNNPHCYSCLLYFTFFADCFIGVTSCIIRFAKGFLLNILFMARLDCSFLGRPIEKEDTGFSAYVSYLYVEVSQTHPVLVAFCGQINDEIIKRRGPHDGYDECCLEANQNNSDDESNEVSESRISQETLQQPHSLTMPSNAEIPELRSQNNIVETTALVHSSHTASENNVSGRVSDEHTNGPPVIPPRDDVSSKSEGNSSSKRECDLSRIPRADLQISLASNQETGQNINDSSNTSTARSSRLHSEVSNDHRSAGPLEDETIPMLVQVETASSILSKRSKSSKTGLFSRIRNRIPFLKSPQELTENRIELDSINVVSNSSEQSYLPQNLQRSSPNIADSFLRHSNAIALPDDQEKNRIRSAVANPSYASVEAIPTLASNKPPNNRTIAHPDNAIKTESPFNKAVVKMLPKVTLLPTPPTYYKMPVEEKRKFQRRKRAIFRWCLFRTLIRNCTLSSFRKYYTELALVKFAEEYNDAAANGKPPSIDQKVNVMSPSTIVPPLIRYLSHLKERSGQENHYPTSPAEFFAIEERERVLGMYRCNHGLQRIPITSTSGGFVPEVTFEFQPVTPEQIPETHSEASVTHDPTATRSKTDRTVTSVPATPSSVFSGDFRSISSSKERRHQKKKRFQYSYDISPPRTLLSRAASPTNLSRETQEHIRLPTQSPFTFKNTGRTAQRMILTSSASKPMTATVPDASQPDASNQQLPTIPGGSTLRVKVEVHHVATPDA